MLLTYVRRGQHELRKWLADPRVYGAARGCAHVAGGFLLAAASLGRCPQPLSLGLLWACRGLMVPLCALGGCLGYWVFWGNRANLCFLWMLAGAVGNFLCKDRAFSRSAPFLLPALSSLVVAVSGVVGQLMWQIPGPEPELYGLQVAMAFGAAWLFERVLQGRDSVSQWFGWGVAVLALGQITAFSYINLGCLLSGALAVSAAFPAGALAGLALDLAGITPVPMTAVMTLSFATRFLPRLPKAVKILAPGMVFLTVCRLCLVWDVYPLPGLVLGAALGVWLPLTRASPQRRGETGIVQVRLEMAAEVFSQTQSLLQQVEQPPIDEPALVARAAEQACRACPCRKTCKDTARISLTPTPVLQKPLHTGEELPISCRKTGRFLAELHRAQEQLRWLQADRLRQQEYREAVIQQYRFVSFFLRELSDRVGRRTAKKEPAYEPVVQFFGNRPEAESGDRCLRFPGTGNDYYVLLCDGMGTGPGAVREGRSAGMVLQKLLRAGYPASHALQSLNSICALRERAGAVTVDLVQLDLSSGKAQLYKWGAVSSYLLSSYGAQKMGAGGPPPGISVTDSGQACETVSLRQGQWLLLTSDGIDEGRIQTCCQYGGQILPEDLAEELLSGAWSPRQDDATLAFISLREKKA